MNVVLPKTRKAERRRFIEARRLHLNRVLQTIEVDVGDNATRHDRSLSIFEDFR